jgi:hypothetical protein
MTAARLRAILGILIPLAIIALICGNAMRITGEDNRCTAAGGRLEFAATASTEECVLPDGQVIEP